jgi:hypothetical protein
MYLCRQIYNCVIRVDEITGYADDQVIVWGVSVEEAKYQAE